MSRRTFLSGLVAGAAGVVGVLLDPDVSPVGKYVQMNKQLGERYPNVSEIYVPSTGPFGGVGSNTVIVRGASSLAEEQEIRRAYYADAEKISKALDDADAKQDPERARRGFLKGFFYSLLVFTGGVALVTALDDEVEKGESL